MKAVWAVLVLLLTILLTPVVADDVEKWIQDLEDSSPYVREAAIKALHGLIKGSNLNDTNLVEPLIEVLKDENPSVRENAAESLGILGDTRAVEPLIGVLKDENQSVQEIAAWSLGKLNDTRAVGPLIELIDALEGMDSHVIVIPWAKDKDSVVLKNTIAQKNSRVRTQAITSLDMISDDRPVEQLIEALRDHNQWVQRRAAKSLGMLGDTST